MSKITLPWADVFRALISKGLSSDQIVYAFSSYCDDKEEAYNKRINQSGIFDENSKS